jgi:hypothetical protein
MITLDRRDRQDIPHSFAMMGTKDALEDILTYMTPMFVYTDHHGTEKVRWSIPRKLAGQIFNNLDAMTCQCCNGKIASDQWCYHIDTWLNHVKWALE